MPGPHAALPHPHDTARLFFHNGELALLYALALGYHWFWSHTRIHCAAPEGGKGLFPLGKPEAEYEVLVVVQPRAAATTPDEHGWPPGYFEKTFGSIDDESFVRPPQGELPRPVDLD